MGLTGHRLVVKFLESWKKAQEESLAVGVLVKEVALDGEVFEAARNGNFS